MERELLAFIELIYCENMLKKPCGITEKAGLQIKLMQLQRFLKDAGIKL